MIGDLNNRITIKAPRKTSNGRGGYSIDLNNPIVIGGVWAAVEYISGTEAAKYGGRFSETYLKFEVRDHINVSKEGQVVFKQVTYSIEEIVPAKNKRGYLWIYAREAVN
jgi:SPP1 family predicted phage head-tail adaptor